MCEHKSASALPFCFPFNYSPYYKQTFPYKNLFLRRYGRLHVSRESQFVQGLFLKMACSVYLLNGKDEKDCVSPNCKQVLCTFTICSSLLSHSRSDLTHLQLEEEVWQPCWGNRGTRRPNQPCWLPHKQGCSDNQTSPKLNSHNLTPKLVQIVTSQKERFRSPKLNSENIFGLGTRLQITTTACMLQGVSASAYVLNAGPEYRPYVLNNKIYPGTPDAEQVPAYHRKQSKL